MPVCPVPLDWRQDEFLKWAGLPVQGVGILGFHGSRVNNSWLAKPWGFKEQHYISALQLCANVYPTRESLCRGRPKSQAPCRYCPTRLESCSHILGQCLARKGARIARHHKMRALLAAEAEGLG